MEFIKSWITNITVVIIFIMLLDIVMPSNDMKRFVKVIMGLLIILVIIKPFIMAKDLSNQFQLSMTQAAAYIEQSDKENKSVEVSNFQNTSAFEIYKKNLSDKISEIVKSHEGMEGREVQVSLDIENDMNKQEFGSIKAMKVLIGKDKAGSVQTSKIEPVKINTKTVINKKQPEYNLNNSKLSQDLRLEIETALGLKNSDISVEIQE